MRTWDVFADLPLRIHGYHLDGLLYDGAGWDRRTTLVRLSGDGHEGVGEDVNYFADEQIAFQKGGNALPLAGNWTLAEFAERLDTLPLFEGTPEYAASTLYRRWAFESAAVDLALRQAETGLCARLRRARKPLRFVVSLAIDSDQALARLRALHQVLPDLEFKLDAGAYWSASVIADLAALDRVVVVDFKGAYVGTPVDQPPDTDLYRRVVDGLPNAVLEDPHRTPACDAVLASQWHRVSWDAPIHGVADLEGLEHAPRIVNLKPSRIGTLERLCDTYDWCRDHRVSAYGGGQFELGAGRRQIQSLASAFHAEAPNDVAPTAFNTAERVDGLPGSPLAPRPATGFR